jgi:hypothetical protein
MFSLLSCVAIAAPILAYVVPSPTASRPRAARKPANTRRSAGKGKRCASCTPEQRREWATRQFAFGRAIEEYEKLIDRTAAGLP